MSLKLTNSITGLKEIFLPISKNIVNIYCCGVTVYDLCHLGHARSYIAWDVLRRYLIWNGYKVNFVQNFTDIDDKILKKAETEGSSMEEVSERNIKAFHQDMDELGIMEPDSMPRATKCLDEIKLFIEQLEKKGFAYAIDGDVYFEVSKDNDYGKLSKRDIEQQQLNADGRLNEGEEFKKKNKFDFALWKSAKEGEASFNSPWGDGRPGWHIECSAMARKELGVTIDIHLGGADLIFPHHENEIAQSESANGVEFAKYWLHNGMVNVEGKKMSKSLGNFTTIRGLLQKGISPMTLRVFVLQAHYRKPLDFTEEALKAAEKGWQNINTAISINSNYQKQLGWEGSFLQAQNGATKGKTSIYKDDLKEARNKFISLMDDDLNTSGALSVLFDLSKPIRSLANQLERGEVSTLKNIDLNYFKLRWELLLELSSVLGLRQESTKENSILLEEEAIKKAIKLRKEAKLSKNYSEADKIRKDLESKGVELIDKSNGITEWLYK